MKTLMIVLLFVSLYNNSANAIDLNYLLRDFKLQHNVTKKDQGREFVKKIFSFKKNVLLGSITKICNEQESFVIDGKRNWYITAAHVIGKKRKFILSDNTIVHVEMVDDLMDIALLSSQYSSRELYESPCAILSEKLLVGKAFDVESAVLNNLVSVEIETLDKNRSIMNYMSQSVVSVTYSAGLSGRDNTGPMLMLLNSGVGIKGQSGGAILAYPDYKGLLMGIHDRIQAKIDYNHLLVNKDSKYDSSGIKLIGIILAVDVNGERVAALPSTTILKRLTKHFEGLLNSFIIETKPVLGGIKYLKSGAIHFRNTALLDFVGTGDLVDGGSGDLVDGGSEGFFADFNNSFESKAVYSSGILHKDKLWLSIPKYYWLEYEAVPRELFDALNQKRRLDGFFQYEGQIFSTSYQTKFNSWIYFSPIDPRNYDLSKDTLERFNSKMKNCILTLGILRKSNKSKLTPVLIPFCQYQNKESSVFELSILKNISAPKTIKIILRKKCEKNFQRSCRIDVNARLFNDGPINSIENNKSSLLFETYDYFQKIDITRGMKLNNLGLRYYFNSNYSILINRFGGYRIKFFDRKLQEEWTITGPASTTFDFMGLKKL